MIDTAIVKRLLKELTPYKKELILIGFFGLIMAGAAGQMAVMVKKLLDALQTGDTKDVYLVPGLIVLLVIVGGAARYFHYYLTNILVERVAQELRKKMQSKFMRLNVSFHNEYESGSGGLISRILNDISLIQTGLRNFADLFREPFLLVFLIGWLFYLNYKLTFFMIIFLPIILKFLRQISRSVAKYSKTGQMGLETLTSTVKESLDGVRIIQSFNLESEMEQRFDRQFNSYFESRKKIHARMELSGPASEVLATILGMAIILYMALEISKGNATYGDFASYIAALLMINKPLKVLQDALVRVQETIVASARVFQIIDDKKEVLEVANPKPFPKDWSEIVYDNVSFSYGQNPVLKDINLRVKRGEMVAFVGASGSGKSTLVNLLERFFDPTSGKISIDGTLIQQMSLKELRSHIALVTQDVYLFSDTIEKNIWAGDFSRDRAFIEQAAQDASAHDFIMRTPEGYQSRVGERGSLFSGGEKQRISIARALFKNAPILILDEATSALDSQSEADVQKALDRLMMGRTTLVIAHRLSTVMKADRIFVMRNGQIVESGHHTELLNSGGEYAKLYQMQFQ